MVDRSVLKDTLFHKETWICNGATYNTATLVVSGSNLAGDLILIVSGHNLEQVVSKHHCLVQCCDNLSC